MGPGVPGALQLTPEGTGACPVLHLSQLAGPQGEGGPQNRRMVVKGLDSVLHHLDDHSSLSVPQSPHL